jgi:RNA polymerase-binding transcription factor DksA
MAGGWARDGAVQEQIDASINDELARLKARKAPVGKSLTHCAECEETIPEKRRIAIPGVKSPFPVSNCASTASKNAMVAIRPAAGSIGGDRKTAN